MDGLALLCNLHADGPLTLRRLRHAGVRTLRDLEGVPEATLTSWLGGARARRFVEEARQLAGRLAEAPLEPEESPEQAPEEAGDGESGRPVRAEPGFSVRNRSSAFQSSLPRETPPRHAPPTHDAPIHDAPIRAGAFTGLDVETCARLNAHGVRTLAALVAQADLALARRSGIPYPKLLDLASEAQRFLAEQPRAQRTQVRSERPSFGSGAPGTSFDRANEPLRAGAIEGLEAEICERLSAQGVRTLAALVAETSLALARRSGIPYPKLLDLSSRAAPFVVERNELRPEPPRHAPALEKFSIAASVRDAPRSWSARAREKSAPASELACRPDDPGVAGPFG